MNEIRIREAYRQSRPSPAAGVSSRMDSDACLPVGSSSAPVHRPHPNAPLGCMETNSGDGGRLVGATRR